MGVFPGVNTAFPLVAPWCASQSPFRLTTATHIVRQCPSARIRRVTRAQHDGRFLVQSKRTYSAPERIRCLVAGKLSLGQGRLEFITLRARQVHKLTPKSRKCYQDAVDAVYGEPLTFHLGYRRRGGRRSVESHSKRRSQGWGNKWDQTATSLKRLRRVVVSSRLLSRSRDSLHTMTINQPVSIVSLPSDNVGRFFAWERRLKPLQGFPNIRIK